MTPNELKQAAAAVITATKYICKRSKCNACRLNKFCGKRAPEGLTEEEIERISEIIAIGAETEE